MKTLFVSLGCDKNTVDTRKMAGILEDGGICSFTEDEEQAEACVVNTCAFIDSAKQESIDEILSLAQLKKTGKLKHLIVTGCLAQRYQDEILKLIPEVDAVIGTTAEGSVGEVLKSLSKGEKVESAVLADPSLAPENTRQVLTFGSTVGYLSRSQRGVTSAAATARSRRSAGITGAFRWSRCSRMPEALLRRAHRS